MTTPRSPTPRRQTTGWPSGRTYDEQRYSPLAQVNQANVGDLGVDWYRELPEDRSLHGTPLVVDGVMYFGGSYNVLRAVDATSGELLWEYDPQVIEHAGDRLRIMWDVSRGIAFYRGKVYVATIDGRLIAVDAGTGEEVWSVMTFDPELPLFITGAPKAFRGLVVIGNGGTELGAIRGYLDAYDAETGERIWRWYTVPGNPADGYVVGQPGLSLERLPNRGRRADGPAPSERGARG